MKREMKLWQLLGFGVTSLLGTLLHFLYDWTGESPVAALFSGVNESTWEHMKLLFFPLFLFAAAERLLIGRDYENFWCVKLKGTLLGLLLIPVIFYTLGGIFGSTPDLINIAIFFLSAAAAFLYETAQFNKGSMPCRCAKACIAAFALMAVAFWVFTFLPPRIPLFQDPITGSFGAKVP